MADPSLLRATWDALVQGHVAIESPASVAIGSFDGLHRGHAELIRRLAGTNIQSKVVVTFRQPPRSVLSGESADRLMTARQKEQRLQALGVTHLLVIDFSRAFSSIAGKDFLAALQRSVPLALLVVGSDFRCGTGRDTGVAEMRRQLGPAGVVVDSVEPIQHRGEPVSSSRIRRAIRAADFATATELLGRPYTIEIEVGGGKVTSSASSKNGGDSTEGGNTYSVARAAIGQLLPEPGSYPAFEVDRDRRMPVIVVVSAAAVALRSQERLDALRGHTIEFDAVDGLRVADVAERHAAGTR